MLRFFRSLLFALTASLFALARPAAAQEPPPSVPSLPAPAAETPPPTISPGKAFLRAILVPGWGHASIGSHTRGGFYFLAETSSAWMVVRTRVRLNAAKSVRDLRLAEVRDRLAAEGITDLSEILLAQEQDDGVIAAESLVEARSQQFEDWLVLGIFFVFLSGADAFVSTHLKDFPQPVGVAFRPGENALEVGVSLPLGSLPRD